MSWKVWALLSTLAWAAWGVAVKSVLGRLDWARLEVLSALSGLILMVLVVPSAFNLKADFNHLYGLGAGALGAAGAIFFYIALSKGPVSAIVPLTSLYIVGVPIAGLLFFGEALTVRKVAGVLCAVAAAYLLASE
jgi:transporter family protein